MNETHGGVGGLKEDAVTPTVADRAIQKMEIADVLRRNRGVLGESKENASKSQLRHVLDDK